MPPRVAEIFEHHHEADFAYSVPGVGRFRVNAFYQRSSVAIVFRRVRPNPGSAEELGLPAVIYDLADEHRGLVLVTGPTGSGKTTTLATMIDHINRTRPCHIVTIEDPIEYLHRDDVAVDRPARGRLRHRFVRDGHAGGAAPGPRRHPRRRDARHRDRCRRLTAAETGHLVLSTLHTIDATETINRIVDFFPPHQQTQIRVSLAGALSGTVAQRLVRRADGNGRLPALEVMVANGRIRQCIADPELTAEIDRDHRRGRVLRHADLRPEPGPATCRRGTITLEEALQVSSNPHDLRVMLERRGLISTGSRW